MNFGRSKTILLAALFALVVSAFAFADTTLYTQAYDNNGNVNASQNDVGGLGNFATMYDNWNINPGGIYTVNEVQFTGGYFNGNPGNITGWTVSVYFDNGGQPGTLQHTAHISGNGNETLLGGNIYTYDISGLGFQELSGVEYWLALVPDLSFPPQWGWATGTGGDGISYQDFFGQRSQVGSDSAFTLIGTQVPEPGSLVLLGTGVLGLAGAIRRRLF